MATGGGDDDDAKTFEDLFEQIEINNLSDEKKRQLQDALRTKNPATAGVVGGVRYLTDDIIPAKIELPANIFNTLGDIVEEIRVNLEQVDQNKLQRLLLNEARKKKLDAGIIDYLTSETDLKRFIEAFQDARNIQICFVIDTTGSMRKHYDNFKNHVFGSIIEGIVSGVNKGEKRYAFVGYRERNEPHEFVQFTDDIEKVSSKMDSTSFQRTLN